MGGCVCGRGGGGGIKGRSEKLLPFKSDARRRGLESKWNQAVMASVPRFMISSLSVIVHSCKPTIFLFLDLLESMKTLLGLRPEVAQWVNRIGGVYRHSVLLHKHIEVFFCINT